MSKSKNELMFKDEAAIINAQKELVNATKSLNDYARKVKAFFGTDAKIDYSQLISLGTEPLFQEFRNDYPFPNSDDDFNIKALGRDPRPLFVMYRDNLHKWNVFNFEYKNGEFVPGEDQPEISQHYYYADSEDRKRVLGLMTKTKDLLQELEASNLYNSHRGKFLFDVEGFANMNSSVFRMFVKEIDKGEFNFKK